MACAIFFFVSDERETYEINISGFWHFDGGEILDKRGFVWYYYAIELWGFGHYVFAACPAAVILRKKPYSFFDDVHRFRRVLGAFPPAVVRVLLSGACQRLLVLLMGESVSYTKFQEEFL